MSDEAVSKSYIDNLITLGETFYVKTLDELFAINPIDGLTHYGFVKDRGDLEIYIWLQGYNKWYLYSEPQYRIDLTKPLVCPHCNKGYLEPKDGK